MTATEVNYQNPAGIATRGATGGAAVHETVIQPRTGWVPIDWRELVEHRELLYFLVLRDVKVRYKQTVLGVVWTVLPPVLSMVIFTFIIGKMGNMSSDGVPYPVFVFSGLVPWTFFSNSVGQGSQSLVNQQALLTKIYLPRMFIPAGTIGGALVDMMISMVVLAVVMAIYGQPAGWGVVALPCLVLLAVMSAVGVTLALAALTVSYRDFRYVIPVMMQAWLFLSPVVYPVSNVPERFRWILALNPMTGVIDGFRSALFAKPWDWSTLTISSAVGLGVMVFGLFYFRRTERRFADVA